MDVGWEERKRKVDAKKVEDTKEEGKGGEEEVEQRWRLTERRRRKKYLRSHKVSTND